MPDCICYTNGFVISTLMAGTKSATGIDLDEKVLETAQESALLNAAKNKKSGILFAS